ncbi:MAG TPA: YihY/virulence factor BrkB family protein [Streptosporangiaceae bacterium]|jgi:membrane protein|nr:YihY/virulence factor BrkB family protein [Streptosporangiaceae bacterium]
MDADGKPAGGAGDGAAAGRRQGKLSATIDGFQQRHAWMAIPWAVLRKFSDDNSSNLAAMIAFWAFFSIFPLLLVFVTLLGFFLPASMKTSVLTRVAEMFPLLSTSTVRGLGGDWWPLLLGAVSALWSGLSVVRTIGFAFDSVWEVPQARRPKFAAKVLRSLWVLAVMGGGLVVSVLVTGFVAGAATGISLGWAGRLAGYLIAIALDVGLFIAAFRVLTQKDLTVRDVLPGAVLSGAVFWILEAASSLIISRYLHKAQGTYGRFATVITILWWFYLQALVSLFGAQLNVVLRERLYPRSLARVPGTEADRRAYRAYAGERGYHPGEHVDVTFRRRPRQ